MPKPKTPKKSKPAKPSCPKIQIASMLIIALFLSTGALSLFILISGSGVAAPISFICALILCILPSAAAKLYAVVRRIRQKQLLSAACAVGLLLSLPVSLSYYVSHDYELSVYRYMRKTDADKYYFAGYESYLEDYADASDFMRQMKEAPASIVLEDMSADKLSKLSAAELKQINKESLWDYCGFDDILGVTPEDVEASMKAASEMNAYEFTFDYRGLRAKTFGYILSHPKLLLSDLNSLAKDSGKHSVSFVWIVIFIFAELFAYRLVLMRIEVVGDKGKRLVYVAPAAKKSKNKGKGNDNAKDKPAENSDSVNSD